MTAANPFLPPRWVVRAAWILHRAIYSITGGRRGLRPPTDDLWGMMRLRTIGRRTGAEREDGGNFITMAMNGWADPEPAWWLNLRAHPEASVNLGAGWIEVTARAADTPERPRLWSRWAQFTEGLDAYAARRSRTTQVVVLEPRSGRQAPAA